MAIRVTFGRTIDILLRPLHKIGISDLYASVTRNALRVLCYHRIGEPPRSWPDIYRTLWVPNNRFQDQISYLKDNYSMITMDDLLLHLETGTGLPDSPLLITFDDGTRDFIYNVLPVLKKHSVPATMFLATNVEQSDILWRDVLDWEEILRIRKNEKLISFGAHTVSHKDLTLISMDDCKKEVFESKRCLEDRLGIDAKVFAYPYGRYNEKVAQVVLQAGFAAAFTTEGGINKSVSSPYKLKRISVGGGDSSVSLSLRVSGIHYELRRYMTLIGFSKLV